MPAIAFTIEIEPVEDTYTPALDWIAGRLVDIAPAYEALDGVFRKIEARRFTAEGPGWAELAASTVAQRGSAHPILVAPGGHGRSGGQLRRSLTTKGSSHVVEPLPDGLFMGTDDPIAKYHQDGTRKMPARPVVDLTEADAEAFSVVLSEYFYGFKATASVGAGDAFSADVMAGL